MKFLDWKQTSGCSWKEIGNRICVSGGYLSQIAHGSAVPSDQIAVVLVSLTGGKVTYEELVQGARVVCQKRWRGPSFNISHKFEKYRDENDMHML